MKTGWELGKHLRIFILIVIFECFLFANYGLLFTERKESSVVECL